VGQLAGAVFSVVVKGTQVFVRTPQGLKFLGYVTKNGITVTTKSVYLLNLVKGGAIVSAKVTLLTVKIIGATIIGLFAAHAIGWSSIALIPLLGVL